jgi:aldose 1-epimerase
MYKADFNNKIVTLQSPTSTVTVWPQQGAILNGWQVTLHNKIWEVVDGYDSFEDFEQNCEAKGFRSCKLSPFVCRMKNSTYQFEGTTYKTSRFELLGQAIHGLLYTEAFEVVNTHANDKEASATLVHHYKGADAGYPFHYIIEVTYTLSGDNNLTLNSKVINNGNTSIPLSDGWHPYFKLGKTVNDLQFYMAANTIVEFDDKLLPTGNLLPYHQFQEPSLLDDTELDNCFVLNNGVSKNACLIINKEDNIQLAISANENYPYLQVYTPPHRNSIAVENLSSVPDAFNNHIGLKVLGAGESVSFSCSYQVGTVS